MLKLQRTPALLASSLGLVIACCLSSSAYAILAVSVAAPGGAALDSDVGDVWTVASIGSGVSDIHGDSSTNALTGSVGPSGDINDGDGAAWGITSDGFSLITATATFDSALAAGDFVSIDFDNGGLGFGSRAEVRFLDASDTVQASLIAYGGSSEYLLFDAGGVVGTGISLTADGFNIKFDQMVAGTYQLTLSPPGSPTGLFTSRLLSGGTSASVEKIQIFNQGAGSAPLSTVFFNNLDVSGVGLTAVPEASAIVAIPFALSITGVAVVLRRRRQQQMILVPASKI